MTLVIERLFPFFSGGLLFAFGTIMGSWLYLLAERLPRSQGTLFRSRCPVCKTNLPARSLIPLISWCLQRGRCLFCQTPLSFWYPLVEFLTGLGTLLIFWFYQRDWGFQNLIIHQQVPWVIVMDLLVAYWLFFSAIPLFFTDLRYFLLPDVITLPGIFVSLALGFLHPQIGWQSSLGGALLGGGVFWATAFFYLKVKGEEGLGFGDVKYMALIGGAVGWQQVFWVFLFSCSLGALVGVIRGLQTGEGLKASIPFGPFLSLAGFLVHLFRLELS